MKNLKFIVTGLFSAVIMLSSFGFYSSDRENCFPMIWNQGITKKSWVYLNQGKTLTYRKNSDLTEGDRLGMPKNNWDATYTDAETQEKFSTPDKTNASFKLVTLGYKIENQKKKVGFDFIVLNENKKASEPYIFKVINNSQKETTQELGTLREVGFVFENWPQYWPQENKWAGGQHSFSDNYQMEDLDKLIVKFKFRLTDFNTPLNKKMIREKWLGSYVTCDLRFNEYDINGKMLNRYLIGVVFSNPLNLDFNDNLKDRVFYGTGSAKAGEQQVLLLHGSKNGIKEINKIGTDNAFQTVEIDFSPLVDKYLHINTKNKNIITGLDIYSATRAADLSYEIQDIRVIGCTRN